MDRPDDVNLLPGMTARVVVDVELEQTEMFIPLQAVLSSTERAPLVWVIDQDEMTVSAQEVEIGEPSQDSVPVISGLEPGAWIALTGVHQLEDGMRVTELARA
jgi:multidrug efflux pump subunit AcrA (membrane-fusion protein)